MKLDVPDFKPEELQVKISNNMVTIEGKQETTFSSKQFFKKFSIPQGVKPDTITSSLSPKGVLTISAPIQSSPQAALTRKVSTEQQVVQQQQQQKTSSTTSSVKKEQVQQSDSTSSLSSNISRDLNRRLEQDFVLRPVIDMDSLLARDTRFEDISKELCQVKDDKKFETKLEVSGFQPEELQIKISDNMVTITGKQEMREENNFSSRQFYKKFSIPQGVKPENITSSLSPQGVLTISAPIDQTLLNQQAVTSSTVTKSQQEVTSQRSVSQQQQQQQVQQQTQQQQVQQQSQTQQVQQQQQKSFVHSDSVSSMDSNVSNVSSIHQNIMKRLSEENFLLRPILDLNSLLDRESRFEDVSKQISQVGSGDKFEVKLDVPDFKPEELEVKISNNMVTIQAKQEMRAENNFSSRQFCKKFSIPQGVKPENISSSLSTKGVLTISAPIDKTVKGGSGQDQLQEQRQTSTTTTTTSTQRIIGSGSNNTQQAIDSSLRSSRILQPKINTQGTSTVASNFEDVSKELCHINDGQTFEMKLDVKEFSPEEIDVKISNNVVTIEGKQEMKEENNFRSRSFCKKFTIPQGVRPESITCSVGPDGALSITAPIGQGSSNTSSNSALTERNNASEVVSQQEQQQTSSSSTKKVSSTFSSTSSQVSSSSNF